MLSRGKHAQLAAIAALTVLFGANASMNTASAQTGIQLAQADRGRDVKKTTTTRTVKTQRAPARASSKDRSRQTVVKRTTKRTVVRDRDNDRRRVVVRRDRDRGDYRWRSGRSYATSSVAFVVLGPRVVYRSYGSGWCRALHSGRHWAPRIGWHRGRHVGAVRCG